MKREKSTKKALFSSILSLVLCLSMLIGTTFAWFTDSVTSANNIIKSGNLDIELYYQNDTVNEWTKVTDSTNIFKTGTLWEPGHTEVIKLKVVNEGSLALKYQFGINIASETGSINKDGKDFKLSDYLYFGVADGTNDYTRETAVAAVKDSAVTVATGITKANSLETKGSANEMTLVVYMPETVGNEANYKEGADVPTINLGLNLFATQYTYEADSFGNDYDARAAILPAGIEAEDFASKNAVAVDADGNFYSSFKAALASGADTLYLAPQTDLGAFTHLDVADDITIYGNGAQVTGGERDLAVDIYKPLTKDITINIYDLDGIAVWGGRKTAYTVNVNLYNCQDVNRIYISGTTGDNNIKLEGCSFDGSSPCAIYSNANGTITVNDTTFTNVGEPINLNHKVAGTQTVNVTNSEFINCGNYAVDQNKWAAAIRVLSTVSDAESVLNAKNNTFTGAKGIKLNGDILLNDNITSSTVAGTVVATVDDVVNAEVVTYPGTTLNGIANTATTPEQVPVVSDSAGLQSAIDAGEETIVLAAATYTMPGTNADITINGTTETKIDLGKVGAKNVTFNGVTVYSTGYYGGLINSNTITYNDCVIDGPVYLYGEKVVFNNCTFAYEDNNDYLWVYAAKNVEINNCTFNTQGKAILIFQDGSSVDQTVKVQGCTFNATKAGYNYDKTIHISAVSIDGSQGGTYNVILNNNTVDSDFNGLWQDKTNAGNITVSVDGETVLSAE